MKEYFSNLADFESFLSEHGFTIENGEYYFTADTNHNSYLSYEHFADGTQGGIRFYDSTSTKRALYESQSSMIGIAFDWYDLADGGFAFRYCGVTTTSGNEIPIGIAWAAVAKEDGSGFEYLYMTGNINGTFNCDDGNGDISLAIPVITNTYSDTSNLAIMVKIYDNKAKFLDIKARMLIATQAVNVKGLYTFKMGNKTYLANMGGGVNPSAPKGGVWTLELA